MFGSEVLCLQSVSSFRKPRAEQVSLIKVADTQHGAHCVSGSCTKYLRESNHLQPRDNLRKGVLSLIPFYRWGYKHRQGFRRLPRDTGRGLTCEAGPPSAPWQSSSVLALNLTCPAALRVRVKQPLLIPFVLRQGSSFPPLRFRC